MIIEKIESQVSTSIPKAHRVLLLSSCRDARRADERRLCGRNLRVKCWSHQVRTGYCTKAGFYGCIRYSRSASRSYEKSGCSSSSRGKIANQADVASLTFCQEYSNFYIVYELPHVTFLGRLLIRGNVDLRGIAARQVHRVTLEIHVIVTSSLTLFAHWTRLNRGAFARVIDRGDFTRTSACQPVKPDDCVRVVYARFG